MATLETLLDTDWNATNVTKPAIVTAPDYGEYLYSRIVHIRRRVKIEEYMDIISSSYYTPDSHDAYLVTVGSTTKADAEDIINEVRRICSQFTPSGDDKILVWEGGEWDEPTAYWHKFTFTIMKRKSGATLPNL